MSIFIMNKTKKHRIVFMGTPEFAVPSLQVLIERGEIIAGVVTQPDRPVGRGQNIKISPVKELAIKYNIPVFQPEKVNDIKFKKDFISLSPDIGVVVAFGRILPPSLLNLASLGFINVHSSLLPAYRGSAPINWAIINGETLTGITVMRINEGMDTGDIILQESINILPEDNALTLHVRLSKLGAKLLGMSLDMLNKSSWNPVPQDHKHATYAPMLKKIDGLIHWEKDAISISNQIRGMFQWPGCFSYLNGKLLKIHRVQTFIKETDVPPGRIISVSTEGIEVATRKGTIFLKEVQLEGGKKMSAEDFIKGHNVKPGMEFTSTR
jgi:methionyl-tRNA formyltransferase